MAAILAVFIACLLDPVIFAPGFIFGALQRTAKDALIWSLGWGMAGGMLHEMLLASPGRPFNWLTVAIAAVAGVIWLWIGYGLIGRRRRRKQKT